MKSKKGVANELESKINLINIIKFWDEAAEKDAIKFIINKGYNLDEFYASGIETVERNLSEIFPDKNISNLKFKNILEIGCGIGRESFTLCDYCNVLTAIDISPNMIDQANKNKEEFYHKANVNFDVCNGVNLREFKSNYFEFVYSFITLQHVGNIAAVFTNIIETNRVLAKKGTAALLVRTNSAKCKDYSEDFSRVDTPSLSENEIMEWSRRMNFKNVSILNHQNDEFCKWMVWVK